MPQNVTMNFANNVILFLNITKMKKIITTCFCLLIATIAFSQNWEANIIKGDELKGTEDYIAYTFEDNGFGFIYWSSNDDTFRLYTNDGFFNYTDLRGRQGNHIVLGLVGFYDESNKLIDKIENFCIELDDEGTPNRAHPNRYTSKGGNNKKNAAKILDYLKNAKGYVRFVYKLYGGKEFDLKVMCKQ